jgi:hypothetical protein
MWLFAPNLNPRSLHYPRNLMSTAARSTAAKPVDEPLSLVRVARITPARDRQRATMREQHNWPFACHPCSSTRHSIELVIGYLFHVLVLVSTLALANLTQQSRYALDKIAVFKNPRFY